LFDEGLIMNLVSIVVTKYPFDLIFYLKIFSLVVQ